MMKLQDVNAALNFGSRLRLSTWHPDSYIQKSDGMIMLYDENGNETEFDFEEHLEREDWRVVAANAGEWV